MLSSTNGRPSGGSAGTAAARSSAVKPSAGGPGSRRRKRSTSGLVAGIDALRAVERELLGVRPPLGQHGREQEDVVVARVDPLEHATHEAVRARVEQRRALGTGAPGAVLELVDLVARPPAEQLRQRLRLRGDE